MVYTVFNNDLDADSSSARLQRNLSIKDMQAVVLEFVNIPRNGGRAIEQAACAGGVHWGSMKYRPDGHSADKCGYELSKAKTDSNAATATATTAGGGDSYTAVDLWHAPPRHLKHHVSKKDHPFHEEAKLFTVVRNPYERLMQEFYDPEVGYKGSPEEKRDKEVLNEWIQKRLFNHDVKTMSLDHHEGEGNLLKHDNLVYEERQYVQQIEYVYHSDGSRAVDHVLHFEDLKGEFQGLMNMFGLNITLPVEHVQYGDVDVDYLTYKDLNNQTLLEINSMAGPDFEAFGYTMIEPVISIEGDDGTILREARHLFSHNDGYNVNPTGGTCLTYNPFIGGRCERN